MGIEARASVKYDLIQNAVSAPNNMLDVSKLCEIAGVSRSGYYSWLSNEKKRTEREEQDKRDFDRILDAYRYRGYKKGARSIHMRLLRIGVVMNIKKIHRLMKKFGLRCPIRRINPYRRMIRAIHEDTTFPNIVNREFTEQGVRKILLTDISYLPYKQGFCYLSTILDACTREVLAYKVSDTLMLDFVLETVDMLVKKYKAELDNTTIIHSDQGCHYTSKAFVQALRDNGFLQSMSRKGNCWDNAPQESFFGHMKDEISYYIAQCQTLKEVKEVVDEWIDYYNTERYQWDLMKLSPREYYDYMVTGVYPLKNNLSSKPRGSAPNPGI